MPLNAGTPAFYGLYTVCIIILFYANDAGRVWWQGYARLSGYCVIGDLVIRREWALNNWGWRCESTAA